MKMKNWCNRHSECVREVQVCAERICSQRGVRLTSLRKRVLEIVSNSHRPVKAYQVLEEISSSAKPQTVYRALDFLIENGLVHKISSMSSYCVCSHPASGHDECFFLICSVCGDAREFCGAELSEAVERAAVLEGFTKAGAVLEVRGVCAGCVGG